MPNKVQGKEVQTRKGTPKKHAISGRTPGTVKTLKGVFFGPPKTGKTTLALSGTNILHMSFDPQGDMTQTITGRKDVTVVTPESYNEVDEIIRALYTTDKGRFNYVVPDSLTFLFQLLAGKDIADAVLANKDPRRAYQKGGASVGQIVSDLVRLPNTNVLFTAHLDKEYEEDPGIVTVDSSLGETEVKLAVTPMVWKILGPAVSFIGRTYKKQVNTVVKGKRNKTTEYRVSFNDGDRSPAGSRIPLEGDYLIELDTMKKLAENL